MSSQINIGFFKDFKEADTLLVSGDHDALRQLLKTIDSLASGDTESVVVSSPHSSGHTASLLSPSGQKLIKAFAWQALRSHGSAPPQLGNWFARKLRGYYSQTKRTKCSTVQTMKSLFCFPLANTTPAFGRETPNPSCQTLCPCNHSMEAL